MKKLLIILLTFSALNASENSVEKKLSYEHIEQANENLSKTLLKFVYPTYFTYEKFYKDVTTSINNGANVNTTNIFNQTALHVVCKNFLDRHDCKPLITYLLEKGIDVNKQDDYKCTALSYAVAHNNPNIVNFLIKNNAKLDIMVDLGQTTSGIVCSSKNADILFRNGYVINNPTYVQYEKDYNDDCENNFKQLKAKLKSKNISLQDLTGMYEDVTNIIDSYISLADWYNLVYPKKEQVESTCCIIL